MNEALRREMEQFDVIELDLTSEELIMLETLLMAVPEEVANSLDAEASSGLWKKLIFAHEDMLDLRKQGKYSFYGESNMAFLRRGKAALDAGEGVEHELLEDDLASDETESSIDAAVAEETYAEYVKNKSLAEYMNEYNEEVIAKATPDIQDFAVRPEIWIYFQWELDQDISPSEEGFGERLKAVMEHDPELGCYLLDAFELIHINLPNTEQEGTP